MEFTQIVSFIVVASLLVMSPGPNGVLIAKTVPISGQSAGFANIAGFVAAFYLHGSLSILGISVLLTHSAQAFFIVKMLGAAYLCWVGVKALYSAWCTDEKTATIGPVKSKRSLSKAFLEGFLTNALNPKVSMFYLAAFPQFIPQTGAADAAFFLVFIHSIINLAWFSGMVLLFSKLKGVASNGAFQRILKTTTGLIFIGFGTKLASLRT
ncbi:LysE family translocator [Neptunomonas japonica]|uniref:LysE family translocator n=1 Tax=Neptunomonas japonica TaxID=417574 RepID=UPI00040BB0D8|nr:LysE family translocator [Neptunomonas japonica]